MYFRKHGRNSENLEEISQKLLAILFIILVTYFYSFTFVVAWLYVFKKTFSRRLFDLLMNKSLNNKQINI